MKHSYIILLCFAWLSTCTPAQKQEDATVASLVVKNTTDTSRKDAVVSLELAALLAKHPDLQPHQLKFSHQGQVLTHELSDTDGDGTEDMVRLLIDFAAQEEKTLQVDNRDTKEEAPTLVKRTQAELSHKVGGQWKEREYEGGHFQNVTALRVPSEHTDHSWFVRYEGPGWESDLVGYRFYLDWRNATDIFGKKKPEMVLQSVGQDGFDSYHEPADWGMDILKVGSSLGIGAIGSWVDDQVLRVETTDSIHCKIVENGHYQSKVKTTYYGWQVGDITTDLVSELSIQAGSRLTRHDVSLSQDLRNLCTGIVKHEKGKLLQYRNGTWAYLATWGQQSLAEDYLGMAVLYKISDLQEVTEDEHSHVVVLSPEDHELTYYFLAAWEQDPNGIHTQEAFQNYLNKVVTELSAPPLIKL